MHVWAKLFWILPLFRWREMFGKPDLFKIIYQFVQQTAVEKRSFVKTAALYLLDFSFFRMYSLREIKKPPSDFSRRGHPKNQLLKTIILQILCRDCAKNPFCSNIRAA
jgi:hypothetical protein